MFSFAVKGRAGDDLWIDVVLVFFKDVLYTRKNTLVIAKEENKDGDENQYTKNDGREERISIIQRNVIVDNS